MQADGLGLPGYNNTARGMKAAAAPHTYTQIHKTIFHPIPGPPSPPSHPSALAKSWLAHNCTHQCVCVCVPEGLSPLHQPVMPVVALANMHI